MEHESQCGGHQPEQLLEQPQVSLAFVDKVVRIKDEESAPLHTEVEADDAEPGPHTASVVHRFLSLGLLKATQSETGKPIQGGLQGCFSNQEFSDQKYLK